MLQKASHEYHGASHFIVRDMEIALRQRFFESLHRVLNEGYDTPFNVRSSGQRLRRACEELPLLWYNGIGWWFEGSRYVELYHKEIRAGISWCFDRVDEYASMKQIKDLALQVRYRLEAQEREDIDSGYISFRNGMIDLSKKNLSLLPHDKDVFVTRYLDYDYDPGASCPLWRAFLSEVLPDSASRDVLQEFLGAVFIDRSKSKIETMLWLYGDGANGKSVVFDVVLGILGRENVTTRDMRDLCHPTRGQFAISDIDGKLLNYCSDVQGEFVFTDLAKKLISGEPTHGERKFENSRIITHLPLFMANTNTLPKIKDTSNAWARRVKIIPFNITIPAERQDKSLALKLLAERSGILSWMLEGRRRFLRQGCNFSVAPQCDRLMFGYRSGGFDVLDFMQYEGLSSIRQYVGDSGKNILTKDLYRVFCSWLEVSEAPQAAYLSLAAFRTRLKRYGYIPFHSRGGSTIRAYSSLSAPTQRKHQQEIADEPALQVPEAPKENHEQEEDTSTAPATNRNDVLGRIKTQIREKL